MFAFVFAVFLFFFLLSFAGNLLSGILAKSGPLDFATKIAFLYFLFVKRVSYTYIKNTLFIFQFFILALLQAENQFCPQRGFGGDQKAEIYGF